MIARKPTSVNTNAVGEKEKRCPIIPMPTSFAVTRLTISESTTATGRPMSSARTLLMRSSAKSIPNSLLLRMPSIR